MNRPILSLWPYLWRALLPLVILTLVVFAYRSFLLATILGLTLLPRMGWRSRWLWRLARSVRRFRTASNGRVILHYSPELDDKLDMPTLLLQCEAELGRLTERFGFALRGRIRVFLFADYQEIAKIFGSHFGGTVLSLANAIVIAENNRLQESMRHEFGHLFSSRWSQAAPPLLDEGLSVWLQETEDGQPIDKVVQGFLGNLSLKLPLLLKPKFFFAEPYRDACYVIAGSFTGFLIRRYGLPRYSNLFWLCDGKRFRAKFEKCFGVSLEKAEWQWRNEIMAMETLNRQLERDVCF